MKINKKLYYEIRMNEAEIEYLLSILTGIDRSFASRLSELIIEELRGKG